MTDRALRISIAMATHNGRDFLEDQFQSLFLQTRLPDEVIVYDDASSDDTMDLLMDIQSKAPFKMSITCGKSGLHVNGAFSAALELCDGDVVFFCDQDDVWEPNKIARFMDVFESAPDIGLVFCDASQIDEWGQRLKSSLWETVRFTKNRQDCFARDALGEMLRGGNFIYGMASAFRTEIIRPFCPVRANPKGMTHDTWFALHTLSAGWKGSVIKDQLVRYRRHENQATKKEKLAKCSKILDRLEVRRCQTAALIEALSFVRNNVTSTMTALSEATRSTSTAQLNDKLSHLVLREKIRTKPSPQLVCRALISTGYWKYAKGIGSILRDLFEPKIEA